jgi:uncharacterized protein YxjI
MEEERIYCMHCGARIVPGATFCRICGTPIKRHAEAAPRSEPVEAPIPRARTPAEETIPSEPSEPKMEYPPQEAATEELRVTEPEAPEPAPLPVQAPTETVPVSAPLFDPRRQYYVLDRDWWGFGAGSIFDEKGNTIGHLYRRVISVRRSIEFREADEVTVSAVIRKKLASRDTMDIEIDHDLTFARVKLKILQVANPAIWVEDPKGHEILSGEGDFENYSFTVYDRSRNIVAEIDKAEKWKEIFASGSGFDIKNKYAIVIHPDSKFDRRFIVPIAIAVEEALHEERKVR